MRTEIVAVLLILAGVPFPMQAKEHNAKILEVRKIVRQNGEKHPGWKQHVKRWDYDPEEDLVRILVTDEHGVPRIYRTEGGGDHVTFEIEFHYDAKGHLRFAKKDVGCEPDHCFGRGGERFYFDEAGKRIRGGGDCDEESALSFCDFAFDAWKAFNAPGTNGPPKSQRTSVLR